MSIFRDKFLFKTDENLETKIREKLKANCTPSSKKSENGKKLVPLIAKPTPDVNIKLGFNTDGSASEDAAASNTNSVSVGNSEVHLKTSLKCPISPPLCRGRHRHRSSQDSPNSSGFSSHRKSSPGASPDWKKSSVIKKRLKHIWTVPLYLLQRPGPNTFLLSGEKPNQKFRVTIGPQQCSCGKGPHCIHILFVMLKVLKVTKSDTRLYSNTLKNFEVESLFEKYEERTQKQINYKTMSRKKSFHSSSGSLSNYQDNDEISIPSRPSSLPDIRSSNLQYDEICPICLCDMVQNADVVACKSVCKNLFHYRCIAKLYEECKRENQSVHCPMCRGIWPSHLPVNKNTANHNLPSKTAQLPFSTDSSLSSSSSSSSSTSSSSSVTPPSSTFLTSTPNSSLTNDSCSDVVTTPLTSITSLTSSHTHSAVVDTSSCNEKSSELSNKNIDSSRHNIKSFPKHLQNLAQKEANLKEWIKIFGNEIVRSLMSSDWMMRENGLKHLYNEVVSALAQLAQEDSLMCTLRSKHSNIITHVCCDILSVMIVDPVYKIYISCLRCFRGMLVYTVCHSDEERLKLQTYINPVIKNILNKCADGNRRISQLSLASLVELCKGATGEFALGRQTKYPAPNGIGGISYLLDCIFDCNEDLSNWQWYLGRLYALDKLILEFPSEFYLFYVQKYSKELNSTFSEKGDYKLVHLDRLILILEFVLKLTKHFHWTVRKMAHRFFILAARLTSHIPPVFLKVCNLLVNGNAHLDAKLNEKLSLSPENSQLSSDLLEQVQRTAQNDEMVIYTSIRMSARHCLTKRFQNSSSWVSDKTLLLKKLGQDQLCCDCSIFKTISKNVQKGSCNSIPNNQPKTFHMNNSREKELHQHCCSILPLRGKFNNHIPKHSSSLDSSGKLKEYLDNFNYKSAENLSSLSHHSLQTDSTYSSYLHKNCLPYSEIRTNTVRPDVSLEQQTLNLTIVAPPNASTHCPVGDLIDFSLPSSPLNLHSTQDISRDKKEANYKLSHSNFLPAVPDTTNRAQYFFDAFEQTSYEQKLPSVPGLTDTSLEQFESENLMYGMNFSQDTNNYGAYVEGLQWKKGHLLGTGAFSSCYQARDIKTGTLMAVKQVSFCRNSVEEQEKQMLAIRDEIILMLKLDHPNVVRMLGATLQENHYNMFVEWMPGGSVSALLNYYGPFTEIVTMRYIKQVLAGLAYLHDNKILHRDLKGANLLVDSTGHHLRIGDFGAAARMASQRTIANEFKGQLLGTIAFMAPEVLRGEDYGRSCDVWSVGCIIIEMATTKPPWDAVNISNDLALLYKIACSSSPPPIPADLPKTIQAIALKCLEPKSEDRLPAKELLQHFFIDS